MRGNPCSVHPPSVLGKKDSCCGRKDKHVEVEDHGNGYMFVGTSDISQANRLLDEYVDNPEDYVFAAVVWYEGRACAVWLTDEPGGAWEGSLDATGRPIPR